MKKINGKNHLTMAAKKVGGHCGSPLWKKYLNKSQRSFAKEQEQQCSNFYLDYITYMCLKAMPLCDVGYTSIVHIVCM